MLFPLMVVTLLQVAPTQVVKQFFDAYQRLDIDGMTALMAPDMVFDDPTFRLHAKGRADWRKQMEPNRQVMTSITAEIHSMLPSGDAVAVEYTLSGGIKMKDGARQFKVRCASFFRISASLITRWTDYCDYRTFTEQTRPEPPLPFAMSRTQTFDITLVVGALFARALPSALQDK
jgi:steroid delta-isomerase-like uncharacterized protein